VDGLDTVLSGSHVYQDQIPGLAFRDRADSALAMLADDGVAFPMSVHRTVGGLERAIGDQCHLLDPPAAHLSSVLRFVHCPSG
jgi:hypothetical protein